MDFDSVLRDAGVTHASVSRELNIGTMTLWRASKGRPISAKSAKRLCERFPALDFQELTLGREDESTDAENCA